MVRKIKPRGWKPILGTKTWAFDTETMRDGRVVNPFVEYTEYGSVEGTRPNVQQVRRAREQTKIVNFGGPFPRGNPESKRSQSPYVATVHTALLRGVDAVLAKVTALDVTDSGYGAAIFAVERTNFIVMWPDGPGRSKYDPRMREIEKTVTMHLREMLRTSLPYKAHALPFDPERRYLVEVEAPGALTSEGLDLAVLLALLGQDGLACIGALATEVRSSAGAGPIFYTRGAYQKAVCLAEAGFERVICAYTCERWAAYADIDVKECHAVEELFRYPNDAPYFDSLPSIVREKAGRSLDSARGTLFLDDVPQSVLSVKQRKKLIECAASRTPVVLVPDDVSRAHTPVHSVARRCVSLLGPIDEWTWLDMLRVYSACGLDGSLLDHRPFRAPHYSTSHGGMYAGGAGNDPRPGEVVLANHGVLYLDVPENFGIPALETLGMAIDDGEVVYKVTQDPSTWIRFASDDVWLVMSTDEPGGRPFQRALSTLNLDRPVEFIEVGYTPP